MHEKIQDVLMMRKSPLNFQYALIAKKLDCHIESAHSADFIQAGQ